MWCRVQDETVEMYSSKAHPSAFDYTTTPKPAENMRAVGAVDLVRTLFCETERRPQTSNQCIVYAQTARHEPRTRTRSEPSTLLCASLDSSN
jgi:hypothetical protein